MIFEKGDKVRVKRKNNCIGNYTNSIYKKEYIFKDVNHIEDDGGVYVWENLEDLQLILESPKLTLKLSQSGLKLKVKILHQDDSLRGSGTISSYNLYAIISNLLPKINNKPKQLSILGLNRDYDNDKISYTYRSQEELDSFVSALRIMMKDDKLK
jgi:hypothetical protein